MYHHHHFGHSYKSIERELQAKWQALLGYFSLPENPRCYSAVVDSYESSHRPYHNLGHVLDCLEVLEEVSPQSEDKPLITLSLWLHDAVYSPHSKTNEEDSASFAVGILEKLGLRGYQPHIRTMILLTDHQSKPIYDPEAVLLDCDLSILGAPPTVFRRYEEAIREEYSYIPLDSFSQGRLGILQRFLDRPSIFWRSEFQEAYEEQASKNIRDSIARLLKSSGQSHV